MIRFVHRDRTSSRYIIDPGRDLRQVRAIYRELRGLGLSVCRARSLMIDMLVAGHWSKFESRRRRVPA